MMLQHLGFDGGHNTILKAIEVVLAKGKNLTPDMDGSGSMKALGDQIMETMAS